MLKLGRYQPQKIQSSHLKLSNLSVRSSWWYICRFLVRYCHRCLSENYWEGSHTLSKKEIETDQWDKGNANKLKCEKSLKLSFNDVTLKKASSILCQFKCNRIQELPIFFVAYGVIICLKWRSQWGSSSAVKRPNSSPSTVNNAS